MAALPTAPARATSFTDFSINFPGTAQPGDKLDAEFDRANAAITLLIQFVSTLFTPAGTLLPNSVPASALQIDLLAQLAAIDTARQQVTNNHALKWAEYLAGPVINPADAPAYIAASIVPSGLFYDPVQGGAGGLFSAKYWAVQAATYIANVQKQIADFGATLAGQIAAGNVVITSRATLVALSLLTGMDGTKTAFALTRADDGTAALPNTAAELFVVLDGTPQRPGEDFTLAGSTLTFAAAPYADSRAWAVWMASGTTAGTGAPTLIDGGVY